MIRAVFLGFETTILGALNSCCEVVGVYVATPSSRLRAIRDWPLRYHHVRLGIRSLVARYPKRMQAWHRRLMRYHIADYAEMHGLPQLTAPSVNSLATRCCGFRVTDSSTFTPVCCRNTAGQLLCRACCSMETNAAV